MPRCATITSAGELGVARTHATAVTVLTFRPLKPLGHTGSSVYSGAARQLDKKVADKMKEARIFY